MWRDYFSRVWRLLYCTSCTGSPVRPMSMLHGQCQRQSYSLSKSAFWTGHTADCFYFHFPSFPLWSLHSALSLLISALSLVLTLCSSYTLCLLPRGYIVSVLGRDEGYTVKYNPLPEGVPEGEARANSWSKGLYLTVHPELGPNTDIVSF